MLREETKIPLGALQRPARTAGFDNKRILVAKVKRRRPEGVRTREASALETIRLVLPNDKPSPSAGVFRFRRIGLGENRVVRQNATAGAFWSPK